MNSPIIECDVLIAGSGASGLTAAITAHDAGLKVLVAEKEPVFGGTTAFSAGVVWIPCNDQAKSAGCVDTPELAFRYLASEVGDKLDAPKARTFVNRAAEMLRTIEASTHVKYQLQTTWADYHPNLAGRCRRRPLPVTRSLRRPAVGPTLWNPSCAD